MKYIKTKAGKIYKVIDEQPKYFNCEQLGMEGVSIYKEIVVAQADSIEELCDCFIAEEIKLKAFDIIKDKDVNPIDIRCCDTVEQYNDKENSNVPLTEEEFKLLKVSLS